MSCVKAGLKETLTSFFAILIILSKKFETNIIRLILVS